MAEEKKLSGPDFAEGVSITEFADGGTVQGHANGEAILVTRRGDAYFAIGASCTHYAGPLAEGIIAGDTERAVRPGFVNNPNVRGDHGVLPNRSSSFRRLDDASAPIVKEGTYLSRRGNRS